MKIEIPKVVRRLELGEYAEEYSGSEAGEGTIYVWVNPPRRMIREYFEVLAGDGNQAMGQQGDQEDGRAEKVYGWLAEIWSQAGDEDTHWTAEEVGELAMTAMESDPGLWVFVTGMTIAMIREYRDTEKKGWMRPW